MSPGAELILGFQTALAVGSQWHASAAGRGMELPMSLDALDATGILVACVAAMFATHWWTFWDDFKGFLERCWHREESEDLEKSKERIWPVILRYPR